MHINLLNRGENRLFCFQQRKRDDWTPTFLLGLLILIVNLQARLMTEAGNFIEINSIGVISFHPANYCYGKEARKFTTESFFYSFSMSRTKIRS